MLRRRPDLTARRQRYQDQSYWVVKDPVGLNYFRFQEEEYALLQMLDGESSLDQIKDNFEREFPPQKISVEELAQFIGMLHRSGLVIADVPGQGGQLKKRGDKRKRKERLSKLTNVLSIRFKGVDPDKVLTWMHGYVGWFFSKPMAIVTCILGIAALSLVMVQFDVFQSKLPAFHEFFAAKNWVYLFVALGVTKVIHEFGHGLSCKHFGGECHEMGVMLLVMTPCLYCNVSDSWMLPNKWHRAFIGAAGMYVELVMASIATFVWWFTEPGLVNQLALSTIFVCSVSTLLFNANPLLRYDGYYILSDLMEIPNLRQKSSTILHRKLGAWCLGLEEPEDPFLPQRSQVFFAIYAVASTVYSWVVALSILWFLSQVFGPELKVIGQIIAAMAVYGLVLMPLWKVWKFFYVPGRIDKVKKPRMALSLGVISLVVLAFVFVPLPYHVTCALEVKPRDAHPVYVVVPGKLESVNVKAGQQVQAGDQLALLTDIDLELEVADLTGKRDAAKVQLDTLLNQRSRDPQANQQVPQVKDTLRTLQTLLLQKQQDVARLRLVAPVAGTVLPPPRVDGTRETSMGKLPTWSGTPLDEQNLNAFLPTRSMFCQIGDPNKMEAMLVIDQNDIEFVQPGQEVEMKLEELPHETFRDKITEIAQEDLAESPLQLSSKAGGEIITETDASGRERPTSTSYQARVPLVAADGMLMPGLSGTAKIHVGSRTLGSRFWRYLTRTFNFEL